MQDVQRYSDYYCHSLIHVGGNTHAVVIFIMVIIYSYDLVSCKGGVSCPQLLIVDSIKFMRM